MAVHIYTVARAFEQHNSMNIVLRDSVAEVTSDASVNTTLP